MVSRLLAIITGRLSPRIFECKHGLKQTNIQSRWSDFYKYTRLPVTRWVKLSLNFELLVKKVMNFLLGQRLFNNIFRRTWIIPHSRNNQEN